MDHESVQATALKVVFDLLHLFGLEAFSQTEKDERGQSEQGQEKGDQGGEKDHNDEEGEPHVNEGECLSPVEDENEVCLYVILPRVF